MIEGSLLSESTRRRLRDVRIGLLKLHKTFLEHERRSWEQAGGRIQNSYEFLQLVMNDPFFAWLHSLSGLVVQMDELLDAREEGREKEGLALLDQARSLLKPAETGDEFQRKYYRALQESADVVLAHSNVLKSVNRGEL